MLKCKEVHQLVASGEITRSGWVKRLELRLHLLMCRHCRLYVRQLGKLGELARRTWGPGSSDPAVIASLQREILAGLGPEGPAELHR